MQRRRFDLIVSKADGILEPSDLGNDRVLQSVTQQLRKQCQHLGKPLLWAVQLEDEVVDRWLDNLSEGECEDPWGSSEDVLNILQRHRQFMLQTPNERPYVFLQRGTHKTWMFFDHQRHFPERHPFKTKIPFIQCPL